LKVSVNPHPIHNFFSNLHESPIKIIYLEMISSDS